MQAGIHPKCRPKELVIPIDIALDESTKINLPLAVGFIDLEKSIDSVP